MSNVGVVRAHADGNVRVMYRERRGLVGGLFGRTDVDRYRHGANLPRSGESSRSRARTSPPPPYARRARLSAAIVVLLNPARYRPGRDA